MPGREESQYVLSSPETPVARDPGMNQNCANGMKRIRHEEHYCMKEDLHAQSSANGFRLIPSFRC
jgi:hypothetical protein